MSTLGPPDVNLCDEWYQSSLFLLPLIVSCKLKNRKWDRPGNEAILWERERERKQEIMASQWGTSHHCIQMSNQKTVNWLWLALFQWTMNGCLASTLASSLRSDGTRNGFKIVHQALPPTCLPDITGHDQISRPAPQYLHTASDQILEVGMA